MPALLPSPKVCLTPRNAALAELCWSSFYLSLNPSTQPSVRRYSRQDYDCPSANSKKTTRVPGANEPTFTGTYIRTSPPALGCDTYPPAYLDRFSFVNLAILDFFPGRDYFFRTKEHPGRRPSTANLSSSILPRLTFANSVKTGPNSIPTAGSRTSMRRSVSASAGQTPAEVTIVESPEVVQNAERKMSFPANSTAGKEKVKTSRRRRSSSLMYQEPPESLEQQSDQAVLPNLNSQWVNAKGMSLPPTFEPARNQKYGGVSC